ncbi:hypothetical protein PRZ48_014014 [Zasmidium cellare]|uniref:Uncharacterized protein n=1 Tax=Zasmidium cellare TaxID=395010 RepID=A0ABR0DZR3_ZASCE|nr:hypothetical protein PRZ48_014014 [Zasmidium cellare]
MQSHLDHITYALDIAQKSIRKNLSAAATIHLFHSVRCAYVETEHYVQMRKARRDTKVLASIVTAHECVSQEQEREIVQLLSEPASCEATREERSAAIDLVPADTAQSRARLLSVAIFFAIMAHITPLESHDKIRPHEAARMRKLVFDIWKTPDNHELRSFLAKFVVIKDGVVQAMLQSLVDACKNISLQRMPWHPPARQSSQEVLFQCWLIVDQDIARIEEGIDPHPNVEGQLSLIQQSAQALEALSAPPGGSIDEAFANGCHYAASAKLLRCLHGILSTRVAQQACSSTTASETATASSPVVAQETDQSLPYSADLDFDQVFSEWTNWPYNSTWDMFQSYHENMLE